MGTEAQSWRQQLDQRVVDLRNEAIVQAATAYEFGHRVVRTGIGTVFLGVDQVQILFGRAAERGEQVENDVQQAVGDLRQRTAQTAASMRDAAATRTTATVSSGVASLLNKLPGVSVGYKAPPVAGGPHDDSAQPTVEEDQSRAQPGVQSHGSTEAVSREEKGK